MSSAPETSSAPLPSAKDLFLASVESKRNGPYHYRWTHSKLHFYREIHLKTCIYCEQKNVMCFDACIGSNCTQSLSFCQECINFMFDLSQPTQEEKIDYLQKEKKTLQEGLVQSKEQRKKEKLAYKERKAANKARQKAIDKELAEHVFDAFAAASFPSTTEAEAEAEARAEGFLY
jgi:hypothetical protein